MGKSSTNGGLIMINGDCHMQLYDSNGVQIYIYNNNNEDMINYSDNNTMITITIKMSTYNIW